MKKANNKDYFIYMGETLPFMAGMGGNFILVTFLFF